MSLLAAAAERAPIPDAVTLATIDWLVGQTKRQLARDALAEDSFASAMGDYAIAEHTAVANAQHYELPPEFFTLILGARRKYSCCYYPSEDTTLDQAEIHALERTCEHADLRDGQTVLELGCGWGSLSLFMAERYPGSLITAVSNSHSQRQYITGEAKRRGLNNLTVITADMNDFSTHEHFDRIVSVEMFEHMSNWRALLSRARNWLKADGRLFLHVFTHRKHSYRFKSDGSDWIGKYFFTGGIMPAQDLVHRFPDMFAVEQEWRWSGDHYRRTALDWLDNFDDQQARILPILRDVYGAQAGVWRRRWRLFFLATAGLWGHAGGSEWGVGHYRLKAV
ncbi:cyclopropane-fatty-acyl-phospholipid synthase family protein [Asticcacaulis biprosthecium C19]|uniref:Cyclopropane-fatty-acyl-phospholipid synthase family protein n=1 Tax=Asticcacaulis biprosthecium C19 TaxID=715226 RepID=F4QJX6_9CAUL|nr:cyclopropane-fatty-acyl-phospholipid synthase family protein [Asticcacaulis biprosthecium]EGF93233.1 cyclopropane-fatty-acyl-phospholipid synthase family protein [Asticcacaulis biprosthecium C19]